VEKKAMQSQRVPHRDSARIQAYLSNAKLTPEQIRDDPLLTAHVAHELRISKKVLLRSLGLGAERVGLRTPPGEGEVASHRLAAEKAIADRAAIANKGRDPQPRAPYLRAIFGPSGDFFHMELRDVKRIHERIPLNREAARKAEAFRAELASQKDADGVKRFAADHVEDKLTPEQRTLILEALRSKACWPEAVAFYERTIQLLPRFAKYPIPAEFHLVALNKTEQFRRSTTVAKNLVRDLAKGGGVVNAFDLDLTSIQRTPWVNGETLSALGAAFKTIHDFRLAAKIREDVLALREEHPTDSGQLEHHQHRLKVLEEEYKALTALKTLDAKPLNPDDDALVREECRHSGGALEVRPKALEISTRYYEAGFSVDFEYYPGINAMYNHHLMGNDERFEALTPLVRQSLLQMGGKRSKDYWCLGTQLELALLTNDQREVRDLLPLTLRAAKAGWELGTTAKSLVKLLDHRERVGERSPELEFIFGLFTRYRDGVEPLPISEQRIDEIMRDYDARMANAPVGAPTTTRLETGTIEEADLWSAIMERATYFAGMSSHYLGGNVPYGGLIPDLKVGRTDIDIARRILDDLDLSRTADFETWNEKVDVYLGNQLRLSINGRRPLEDMESPEHHFMERIRKKLLYFTGAKVPDVEQPGDCRTNLMAEVALGRVDCRQTAFSKQLLYDVWKKDNQTRLLREAYKASLAGDGGAFRAYVADFQRLNNQQLVTFSVMIRTPIMMKELYKPEVDEAGNRKRDKGILDVKVEDYNDYENHTFNALITRTGENDLSLEWRDCFYQELYKWGYLPVIPEEIFEASGFRAGRMTPKDHEANEIPVVARVQKYSRGKIETSPGEYGGFHIGGREAEVPPYLAFRKPGRYDPILRAIDGALKEDGS
jgi:hypothetical protein